MTYEMDIAGLKRELPICKVTDDLYIGAFVMFGDVELMRGHPDIQQDTVHPPDTARREHLFHIRKIFYLHMYTSLFMLLCRYQNIL